MYALSKGMKKKYYTYNCRKDIPYKNVGDNRVYN